MAGTPANLSEYETEVLSWSSAERITPVPLFVLDEAAVAMNTAADVGNGALDVVAVLPLTPIYYGNQYDVSKGSLGHSLFSGAKGREDEEEGKGGLKRAGRRMPKEVEPADQSVDDKTEVLSWSSSERITPVPLFVLDEAAVAMSAADDVGNGALDVVALLPLTPIYYGNQYDVSKGSLGHSLFSGAKAREDEEEGKGGLKRAARRMSKVVKPADPFVDDKYFDMSYKKLLMDYWTVAYNEEFVLRYLSNGSATESRGSCSYRKFVPILYKLGNEYLSPEMFLKYEGKLFKWEFKFQMQQCNYGGMRGVIRLLDGMTDPKEDWHLPDGVSLMMYLWDKPSYNKSPSWNPWFCIRKSTIDKAGNGLFAAKEFQTGETIGFYVGNVVYKYKTKWTEKASEEFLMDQGGVLKDDSRTISLVDKEGYRVLVNPHYGVDKNKIVEPPLLMGIHFLNDFRKIFCDKTGEDLKEKMRKHNNVWMDDQGRVKASRRIYVGEELFLSYEGKRPSH
jgi:hypothetical protein